MTFEFDADGKLLSQGLTTTHDSGAFEFDADGIAITGERQSSGGGLLERVKQGASDTYDNLRLNIANDADAQAKIIAEGEKTRIPMSKTAMAMQSEIKPYQQKVEESEGFDAVGAWAGLAAKRASQLFSNPYEFAGMVAQNLPNSAPGMAGTIAGGYAGAATPIPGGALLGSIAGGTAGGYQIEQGGAFREIILKAAHERGIDVRNPEQLAPLIREIGDDALTTSRLKGIGTAGTDAILNRLTLGIAGMGEKAVATEARALTEAIHAGKITAVDAAKQLAAVEAREVARNTIGAKALRYSGVTGMEMGGEMLSEAAGQKLAYGKVDPLEVIDEGLVGLGHGPVMEAGRSTFNRALGIDDTAVSAKMILQARDANEALQSFVDAVEGSEVASATNELSGAIDDFKAGELNPLGLPSYAGPPLVTFPDGSTMTGAEAEQRRLSGMTQQTAPDAPVVSPLDTITPRTGSGLLVDPAVPNPDAQIITPDDRSLADTALLKQKRGELITTEEATALRKLERLPAPALATEPGSRQITPDLTNTLQRDRDARAGQVAEADAANTEITSSGGVRYAEPRTVGGLPTAKLTTERLHQIAADGNVNANTRMAAQAAIAARLSLQGDGGVTQPKTTQQPADVSGAPASDAEVIQRITNGQAQLRTASSPVLRGERVGRVMRQALTQMGRLTGTRVVFYSGDNVADGATMEGDAVYINVKAGINPFQVLGHEATHVLKTKHKEAWLKVRDAVSAGMGENKDAALKEFAANYWTAHEDRLAMVDTIGLQGALTDEQRQAANIGKEFSNIEEFLLDEMISDLGGERWTSPDFWGDVFSRIEQEHGSEKAKGIIQRLVNALRLMLTQFEKLLSGNFENFKSESELSKHVTPEQITAIRSAIADAYAAWIKAERKVEPAGYVRGSVATQQSVEADQPLPRSRPSTGSTADDIEAMEAGEVRETPRRDDFKNQTLPTRWPTSKKLSPSVDDPMITDFETLKQDQAQYEKAVGAILEEPGMHSPDIMQGSLDDKAEHVINRMVSNLLWLYDKVPFAIRERSKLWYDGARKVAEAWAERYEISESQAAGALAVLSPQKDWFMNVTMAERVLDIVHTKMDHTFDEKMDAAAFGFLTKAVQNADKLDGEIKKKEKDNAKRNLAAFEGVKGKTLAEVARHHDLRQMSVWIRAYDEAYHDAKHAIVTPEGGFIEDKTTMKGDPTLRAWGDFTTPGKAASIYLNGTPENINRMLGGEHKVRNFYNNIYAPKDARFTTIDTHAVAADMLRALAGADKPVAENFGKTGGTNVTGLYGTYALHYEAYRRAAESRGVLPREMQSITWEAVRGLFTEGFKGKKDNVAAIDAIWREVDAGRLGVDQARNQILDRAGGINNPDWWQEGNTEYQAILRDKTYKQERGPFRGAKVTFEVAPDPRNIEQKRRWDALPTEVKQEISHKVAWKIAAKALASFGDENMKGELHQQLGGWLDDTNPSLSIWFNKRAAASKINQFARMLGYALNQMGMTRTSQKPFKGVDGKTVAESGVILIDLPGNADINLLYQKIRGIVDSKGKPYVFGHTTSSEQMVIIHTDLKRISTEDLARKVAEVTDYDVRDNHIYAEFPSKGRNNYGLPRKGSNSPESSLRARSDQLRAESGALIEQLLGEHEQKFSTSRSNAAGDRSDRGVFGRAEYGTATEGSVQGLGVHFSRLPRTALNGRYYGTGLRGAEAKRLDEPGTDTRIKQRIYFYIDEGSGIRPEGGVGTARHEVQLNNLYDGAKDPLKLWAKSGNWANGFESEVIDAGFDGYKTNGVAVLLGGHNISLEKPNENEDNPGTGRRSPIENTTAPAGAVSVFSPQRVLEQARGKKITRQATIIETGETVQLKDQDAEAAIKELRGDIEALEALRLCAGV